MIGLHENQKKILEYLLDHRSGATLDELAEFLHVTKTAAKEHLIKVDALGLLTFEDRKGGVGRPRRYYLLSEKGNETFPRQYSWLSNIILELLSEEMGSQKTAKMMERLADKVAASMKTRFEGSRSSAELMGEIAKALNELGYRASLKQSDLRKGAVIEATNCVYHSVAKEHPELCRFDIRFIEQASGGMSVKLESCIARGGEVCRFCLRRK
ncbi:helix-turn-helix transcriptional regulator [Bdellovibrio bacteriovorus]|uniref:helix-turn-helix transcriptional regulator n=1 Tax=Bdellovibrio bacteriovorus TaxID=959 RepID=UPI0035A5C65E